MPAPTRVGRSETYKELQTASRAAGEKDDCAVMALAAATKRPYAEALAALTSVGRKARRATFLSQVEDAAVALGFKMIKVPRQEMADRYPERYRIISLTSHHPDRFPAAWKDGCSYIMHVRGHFLAIVDGVNCDWSRGSAKRAIALYRILPLDGTEAPAAAAPVESEEKKGWI